MPFWQNYKAYLKDNPKNLWFKRKIYGWGWVPVRWEGWAVTLGILGIMIISSLFVLGEEPNGKDILLFFGILITCIVALITTCYKTGEKPKWQWGLPDKDKKD